jgi:hypothetical protein
MTTRKAGFVISKMMSGRARMTDNDGNVPHGGAERAVWNREMRRGHRGLAHGAPRAGHEGLCKRLAFACGIDCLEEQGGSENDDIPFCDHWFRHEERHSAPLQVLVSRAI